MLPLATRLESGRAVPCPDAGQGVVGVSAPEAIEIANRLRASLTKSQLSRLRRRSEENARQIALNPRWAGPDVPCSLQGDDGICTAYSDRPLKCRPLHAAVIAHELGLDAGSDEEESAWAAHTDIVGQGIAEGLTRGLEAAGLDAKIYELHSALIAALDNPDAADRWANGEHVFAGCRLRNPDSDERLSLLR